ncbi:MAG: hypothetical protein J6V05_00575, partial [Alistipes sp.]|nr:hypothetical protein [Alistipes sp.]
NEYKAVALLLSLYSLLPFARYLMHSMQKLRGARYVLYAKKENLRSKSGCSLKRWLSKLFPISAVLSEFSELNCSV